MLTAGGALVTLVGFRRNSTVPPGIEGVTTVDLGRTVDGRLMGRVASVSGAMAQMRSIAPHVRATDVVLARNLEMLALGSVAAKLYSREANLIYESLDIHNIMLNKRPAGKVLRLIESALWRDVDLLVTSSPAFVRNYFRPRGYHGPIRIEENKVLLLNGQRATGQARKSAGPPWRIGWFGMIRCRRSLEILSNLASEAAGAIEIIIRGRPSALTFPDFEAALQGARYVRYLGPYQNPSDLGTIYEEVHFNWAIDFYESGFNSAWLLPCRIYEGSLYGSVPIAENGVETSRWLSERDTGVILDQPIEQNLKEFFEQLTPSKYDELVNRIIRLHLPDLVIDQADCLALVDSLRHPKKTSDVLGEL
jgi:succinoglycan biosynthesis protein ExoL